MFPLRREIGTCSIEDMELAGQALENNENKEGALMWLRDILRAELRSAQEEYEMLRYEREIMGLNNSTDEEGQSSSDGYGGEMTVCAERVIELHRSLVFLGNEAMESGLTQDTEGYLDDLDYFIGRASREVPGFATPPSRGPGPEQQEATTAWLKRFFETRRTNAQGFLDQAMKELKSYEEQITMEDRGNQESADDANRSLRHYRDTISKYQSEVDEADKALDAISLLL